MLSNLRHKLKLIFCFLIYLTCLLYFVLEPIVIELNMNHFRYIHPEKIKEENFTNIKTILYYTPFHSSQDYYFGFGQKPFIDHGCLVKNCFVTNNRNLLSSVADFDAILFHARDINLRDLPKLRNPRQFYIMFLLESPQFDAFPIIEFVPFEFPPYKKLKGFFNWTMTYRRDSDFFMPYGWIDPKNWTLPYPLSKPIDWDQHIFTDLKHLNSAIVNGQLKISEKLKRKTKVAWIASHCHTSSNREGYIKELQKYISVDVFGRCGSMKCPKDRCDEHLSNNYMFYLSFENSLCVDYVTEKFFNILQDNILPVVLGGANYSQIAPPKSYIDVKDFKNPNHLANYLNYLIENHTAYEEYFLWKEYFQVHSNTVPNAMCQLCESLNKDIPEHKIYWNIDQWWRKNGQCEVKGYRYDLKYQTMQVIQILFGFIVLVSVLCIIYKYMVKK